MLGVEEGEDRHEVDARQAKKLVADERGCRLGAGAGLEAGEGRGHLGAFAELAGEPGLRRAERRDGAPRGACAERAGAPGLRRAERRDVALDRDVPGELAARAADRRDRRVLLVE